MRQWKGGLLHAHVVVAILSKLKQAEVTKAWGHMLGILADSSYSSDREYLLNENEKTLLESEFSEYIGGTLAQDRDAEQRHNDLLGLREEMAAAADSKAYGQQATAQQLRCLHQFAIALERKLREEATQNMEKQMRELKAKQVTESAETLGSQPSAPETLQLEAVKPSNNSGMVSPRKARMRVRGVIARAMPQASRLQSLVAERKERGETEPQEYMDALQTALNKLWVGIVREQMMDGFLGLFSTDDDERAKLKAGLLQVVYRSLHLYRCDRTVAVSVTIRRLPGLFKTTVYAQSFAHKLMSRVRSKRTPAGDLPTTAAGDGASNDAASFAHLVTPGAVAPPLQQVPEEVEIKLAVQMAHIGTLIKLKDGVGKKISVSVGAPGLRWEEAAAPSGHELVNEKLSEALSSKAEFSQEEWEAFDIKNLRMHHFIKAGDKYFRPTNCDIILDGALLQGASMRPGADEDRLIGTVVDAALVQRELEPELLWDVRRDPQVRLLPELPRVPFSEHLTCQVLKS